MVEVVNTITNRGGGFEFTTIESGEGSPHY